MNLGPNNSHDNECEMKKTEAMKNLLFRDLVF